MDVARDRGPTAAPDFDAGFFQSLYVIEFGVIFSYCEEQSTPSESVEMGNLSSWDSINSIN
jgi:hypothetical protein